LQQRGHHARSSSGCATIWAWNQELKGELDGKVSRILLIALALTLAVLVLLSRAGRFLVVDRPEPADVLVVLAGGASDSRYFRGLQLLSQGYGRRLFWDARTDGTAFGLNLGTLEQRFIERTAGRLLDKVNICPCQGDSTQEETAHVANCLRPTGARRVLLVTSDFHTRRALAIFRRRLPQYQFSIVAAKDDYVFGVSWWQRREWAKTTLLEWTKLGWWEMVDRWR
jgi:DUF218 domain